MTDNGGRQHREQIIGAGPSEKIDHPAASRLGGQLGEDFSDVRVHRGHEAAGLTSRHGALALSAGRSIAFAPGAYRPGTLSGDAILAHELAHLSGANEIGPAPRALTADAGAEAHSDRAAAHAIASTLGFADAVSPVRRRGGGGLRLQACTPGSDLGPTERAAADTAATRTFGSVPALIAYYRATYGGSTLRVGSVPAGREAETASGTSVFPPSSLALSAPRLGALMVHEMSHLRDVTNVAGVADSLEGFAYAFEIMLLARMLEVSSSTLTATERSDIEARIRVIGLLHYTPPTMPALAAAYRQNFDEMLAALQILFRIADGRTIPWGASGPAPTTVGMTPAAAGTLIVKLLQTQATSLRTPGTPTGDLLIWVSAHMSELGWATLSGVLTLLAPAPVPATPPASTPPSSTATPPSSGSATPPPRRPTPRPTRPRRP